MRSWTFCACSACTRKVADRSLLSRGNSDPGTFVGADRDLSSCPQHDVQTMTIANKTYLNLTRYPSAPPRSCRPAHCAVPNTTRTVAQHDHELEACPYLSSCISQTH